MSSLATSVPLGLRVLLGAIALTACGHARTPSPTLEAKPVTISIFATNDVHGQLDRLRYLGGFIDNLRKTRSKDGGVLLVDAGDVFQGTLESSLDEGAAAIRAYDAMGYAAMALGNHEFDFGPVGPASIPGPGEEPHGALERRIEEAHFPVLSANLEDSSGKLPPWKNLAASTIVTVAGLRIGIIGLLTETAPQVIKRANFSDLHVSPLTFAAAREAVLLRHAGVDLVVVVAHAGGECRKFGDPNDLSSCDPGSEIFRFARALPKGLVNVIVGGHRNAAVAQIVAGIPIVHAASNLLGFSRVDVSFDAKTRRVIRFDVKAPHPVCTVPVEAGCAPGDYEGGPVTPDAAVGAAVAPALDAARALKERKLGVRVLAPLSAARKEETALGNAFADSMRRAVPGADVAINNAGSLRDTLPAGELTYGELAHVMPFDNQMARVTVTGAELRAIIGANLTDGEHGLLSISGATIDARCRGGHLDVEVKHPDGRAILDDQHLLLVASDFMATGGDGLFAAAHVAPERAQLDSKTTVIAALVAGLEQHATLRPDDPTLLDPKHPRMGYSRPFPVRCGPRSVK